MENDYRYILTKDSLSIVVNETGHTHVVNSSHPNWDKIRDSVLSEDYDSALKLIDIGAAIPNFSEGNIEVKHGHVFYKGNQVHGRVVETILKFMKDDSPYKPLVRFLDKLMSNPSRRAVTELYTFLNHKNLHITDKGNFLAYKGVDNNFMDRHTGHFDNSVGQVLEMPRNTVCDDADMGCSYGFHAGTYDYAKGYAHSGGNLMIVEIDPSDVVSVPRDCDCQKLRTSKYKVVGHLEKIEAPVMDEGYVDDYDDYESESDILEEEDGTWKY